ncbi:MOP flippase family protein [Parabacteroides pacaensis]|uniref:MOP flippase family protein n=1 Tax=Parabacteroides pacaensis TaxID=2086575 RepID=UPI000D0F00D4|nr:MOP flippase family protein [Parabacteroides pacaensis]
MSVDTEMYSDTEGLGNKNFRRNVLKGVKWTSLSAFVSVICRLGQITVLTRFLDKSEFGLVAIALLFISFTDIFLDMGISSAVLHRQNITRNQYSSLFWLNIFSGIVIFSLIVVFTPFIAAYYEQECLNTLLPMLAVTILFSSISRLQRTYQQKMLNFGFICRVEMIGSVSMLVASIVLAVYGFGIFSLVYSTLLNAFIVTVVYFFRAVFVEHFIKFRFRISEIKPFFQIGIYQMGSSILDFLSNEMDILIISSAFSMDILGVYSLCKQLSQKVYAFINPIITKVLAPALSVIQQDLELVKEKYLSTIRLLAFINYPIYFFMAYFSVSVLTVLYGNQYMEYHLILSLLCVNFSLQSMGNPVGALQIALGRTDLGFFWTIYRIISYGIFIYIGAHFSIYICIFSILLINVLNILPGIRFLMYKLIRLSLKEYIEVQIRPVLICILLLPLVSIQYSLGEAWLVIAVALPLYSVLYLIFSYVWNRRLLLQLLDPIGKYVKCFQPDKLSA